MKLKARIPYFKLLITLVALQLLGVGFVFFREHWLLSIAQGFIWIGLGLMVALLLSQRDKVWGHLSLRGPQTQSNDAYKMIWNLLKTAGLFLFFAIFIWQINYLSLYQTQPLMIDDAKEAIRFNIAPGELLGFTLRLGLQTWVLGIALALVLNKLPKNGEFGFIRGSYKKLSTFAWYISNISGSAVVVMLLFALSLLVLDVGKFISTSFGADVVNLPQFSIVVFLFSLYLFNQATGFDKRMKLWGEQPHASIVSIILVQLLFVLVVYCLFWAMMHFLPENSVYELAKPFHFDFLDYQKFPQYWQLFATSLSILMIPLLAHYFYHVCQGQSVIASAVRLLLIPAFVSLGAMQAIPHAQAFFWQWMPTVSLSTVPLNEATLHYHITWASYLSVVIMLVLMLMLQRSKALVQSLVDIMPEQVGRRERRVKAYYARAFPFIVSLLTLYLMAGVVISMYFTSIFLMATIVGLVLCFVAGLKRQEA